MEEVIVNPVPEAAPLHNRKTKIICTIGPSCQDVDSLVKLIQAGMNVARLNFSHGAYEYHDTSVANVRQAAKITGTPVAIMLDTKGPEIRTTKLKGGKPVQLVKGQKLTIRAIDRSFEGDSECIGCDYLNMPKVVHVGAVIKIEDGLFHCRVVEVKEDRVETVLLNSGELGETKNMNLPNIKVDLPALAPKDVSDLKWGVKNKIDLIAASFTRCAEDVKEMRKVLGEEGKYIKIISKIENVQGLDNFDEIVAEADGIMVARGDLGVEIPIQKVCMAQKMMIRKCNIAGKPVVTATQMLESMVKNPRPTRAEATDVANAVFDGTDCVMLSGETAKGKFPLQAVETMAKICVTAEMSMDWSATFLTLFALTPRPLSRPEAVSSAAVKTVEDLNASLIVVLTESGASARYVAKYRPSVPIVTVTHNEVTIRQCMSSRAVWPVLMERTSDEKLVEQAVALAKEKRWIHVDDWVVVVSGSEGIQGSAHTLKVIRVI